MRRSGRGRDELVGDQALVVLFGAEGLAGFQAADAFPQGFFEGAADGHHFADGFHLGAERGVGAGEFLEGPLGDFDDDVIDGRLEAGGRFEGDVVADLVEAVAHGELGGDLGDGEAGGLGGERGTARHARVHLDDDHAPVGRIDGELHVGAAGIDADLAQAAQGAVAHHLVFAIGEGLGGGDGDGIAGVHAHGVEVLDGADDDAVVGEIAHHLELEFLPAERALFDEDFVDRAEGEAALQDFDELFLVVGDAAAGAAHGETGAQDAGVADALGELQAAGDGVDELRLRRLQADLAHRVLEQEAVFGLLDGVDLGADQLHAVLIEHAGFGEFDGEIEAGLAADGGEQRIGALAADDLFEVGAGERLDVGLVGEVRVRHDGGRIGIDQDDFVAVGAQGLGGLGAGVIELAGLADDDGAGADDEDAVEVVAARHVISPPASVW